MSPRYRNFTTDQADQAERSGDDGTRTHDPLLAKQVLYQLSYVPEISSR